MNFELSEEQRILKDTAKAFVRKESPLERFRTLRADQLGYSMTTWKKMGELGWLALPFDEGDEGMGCGFGEVALLLEQFGTTLVPEPYVESVLLAGTALARGGSAAQKEQWLVPMMEGELTLALAYSESGTRFASSGFSTTVDTNWILNGQKRFVLKGHAAAAIVVAATTAGETGLFVVEPDQAGVTRHPIETMDGHRAAMFTFDGVKLGSEHQLPCPGGARETLELALDYGAAAACAEAMGNLRSVMRLTNEYLKTREQFGRKIGAFQVLQHRAVDMFIESELQRSSTIKAIIHVDNPDREIRQQAVSSAKAQLANSGRLVTQQAIQLHGGIGITDEADIGLFFKRMHTLNTLFGDERYHLERFSSARSFPGSV